MIKRRIRDSLPFVTVFSLIFVRYLYYGFTYFYQLDDYIQYHNYTAYAADLWALIRNAGMLQSRPLAGLADLFVWSRFYPVMLLAVALLSALYAWAALLLKRVFSRYFRVSWCFVVVMTLLPLGFEGAYWVSASSRIICGLFFAALAAWFFQKFLEGDRPLGTLLPAWAAQFLAQGFYEQALVFSVALILLQALLFRYQSGRGQRRWLWGAFPLLNTVCYFLLTAAAPTGALYSGRMELVLPNSPYYFNTFLPEVCRQIYGALVQGGFWTLVRGFSRGVGLVARDRAVWYLLPVLALCALLFYLARSPADDRPRWIGLPVGLLLALAPLAPFLVIANPWFSFRGAVFSLVGLALIADLLCGWIFRKRTGPAICTAVLAFVCCVAGVSELHDYRETYLNDRRAGETILASAELGAPDDRIGVLGLEPSFLTTQNYFFHEHIHGVTESDWALTGMLQEMYGGNDFGAVTPLSSDQLWQAWNWESHRLESFDRLYFYDYASNTVQPVTMTQTGEKSYDLFTTDGALFARAYEDASGTGRLEFTNE